MTPSYTTYALFGLICLTLLTLPFVPAFMGWLRPTDTAPLAISANYASDIDHFAKRLKADMSAKQGLGAPTGYEDFVYVSDQTSESEWREASKRMISPRGIAANRSIHTTQQLYVNGDISTQSGSSFSALYAAGNIDLGEHSEVVDWAHAEKSLYLGHKSVALRRLSAGQTIELGHETWFERVHAPTIVFGKNLLRHLLRDGSAGSSAQASGDFRALPGVIAQTPSLFLVRGDCNLPADTHFRGSLIVTGFLRVGARTTVQGDLKARGGLSIGPGARIEGAITCEKRIHLWQGVQAWGPVISERQILIGAHAVVGLLEAPTTISGHTIVMESGSVAHGAVWASELGMVKAA